MASIRRNLGLHPHFPPTRDLRAQGVAELMLAVRNDFSAPLTEKMLFSWHAMLLKGSTHMVIGAWRTHPEPMQIASRAMGREVVHFEAPPSSQVPGEMDRFIAWYNTSEKELTKPVIRAALAHLYFESIHPFEDGNGRIGRAIAEKALSQNLQRPVLFSLSRSIESNKKAYYEQLQRAQRSNEITDWIAYFTRTIQEAQIEAEQEIIFTLRKNRFFDIHKGRFNPRQEKVVKRMLEEGPQGFEGGMNARKYVSITGTSSASATRDLQDLVNKGIFKAVGGGRSSRYELFL